MFRSRKPTPSFSISIARQALEAVFDECDRHDIDETGGRLLGTYRHESGHYEIHVTGVLGPAPTLSARPRFSCKTATIRRNCSAPSRPNIPKSSISAIGIRTTSTASIR